MSSELMSPARVMERRRERPEIIKPTNNAVVGGENRECGRFFACNLGLQIKLE